YPRFGRGGLFWRSNRPDERWPSRPKRFDRRSTRKTGRAFRIGIHQRPTRSRAGMNFISRNLARRQRLNCISLFLLLSSTTVFSATTNAVIVGSKKFTESYVLGEIARRALSDAGVPAEHRQGMGG